MPADTRCGTCGIGPKCSPVCAATVTCLTCGRNKGPRGRSVPLAAAGGYCDDDCRGYGNDPQAPHLWPEEWRDHQEGHPTDA